MPVGRLGHALGTYARVFVVAGGAFGLLLGAPLGVIVALTDTAAHGLQVAVGCGVVFGLLMALILGTIELVKGANAPRGSRRGARQDVRLTLAAPVEAVRAQVLTLLAELPAEVDASDPDRLSALTGDSFYGGPTALTVTVHANEAGTEVHVRSRPATRAMLDFGNGARYVGRIVEPLRATFPVG